MILHLNNGQYFIDFNELKISTSEKFFNEHKKLFSKIGKKVKIEEAVEKKLILAVSKEDFFKRKNKIKEIAFDVLKAGKELVFVIEGNAAEKLIDEEDPIEYVYSKDEIKEIVDFNNELVNAGMKRQVCFSEYFRVLSESDLKKAWSLDDVISTNNRLDEIVEVIKKKKLSPYESMIFIHKYISSNITYGYIESGKKNSCSKLESSIISAIKYKKTICIGHASLVKAIIDKLKNPNLKCKFMSVEVSRGKEESSSHALCFVEIHDKKYRINGTYAEDVCNDAGNEAWPHGIGFANCMYPIVDFDNRQNGPIYYSEGSRVLNIDGIAYSQDYKGAGSPIGVGKTKKALRTIYTKGIIKREADLRDAVLDDLIISCLNARKIYQGNAKNPYLAYADEHFIIENEETETGEIIPLVIERDLDLL